MCGLSLVADHGLLIAVASLVGAHRLSFSVESGIFLDLGSNPSPTLAGRFLTPGPPGKTNAFLTREPIFNISQHLQSKEIVLFRLLHILRETGRQSDELSMRRREEH